MPLRGLRSILILTHSFIDRTNTNEKIWKLANEKIKNPKTPYAQIFTFESTLMHRRIKFLGHLLRAENNDPTRAITFQPNTAKPAIIHKRRVGGPKQNWTWETLKLAWNAEHPQIPFDKSETQLQQILQEAKNRQF